MAEIIQITNLFETKEEAKKSYPEIVGDIKSKIENTLMGLKYNVDKNGFIIPLEEGYISLFIHTFIQYKEKYRIFWVLRVRVYSEITRDFLKEKNQSFKDFTTIETEEFHEYLLKLEQTLNKFNTKMKKQNQKIKENDVEAILQKRYNLQHFKKLDSSNTADIYIVFYREINEFKASVVKISNKQIEPLPYEIQQKYLEMLKQC